MESNRKMFLRAKIGQNNKGIIKDGIEKIEVKYSKGILGVKIGKIISLYSFLKIFKPINQQF